MFSVNGKYSIIRRFFTRTEPPPHVFIIFEINLSWLNSYRIWLFILITVSLGLERGELENFLSDKLVSYTFALGKFLPNPTSAIIKVRYFFLFLFFHLTYSRWTSSLPSCLWSQRIFPSLRGSRLTIFLSRCKFSTLTTRQPMVEFYLLTFPRFPLRKKEHKSYLGKNRTHDFRTSRCAAYLLDHSGSTVLILIKVF